MEIQLIADTRLCGICGKVCRHKMTFGIAGYRVLCDEHAKPFRDLLLYPPKKES